MAEMISLEALTEQPGANESLVSIIVPTYQEKENIPHLLKRIVNSMTPLARPFEVIIVDDDSRDGTYKVVKGLTDTGIPARLIIRCGERGLSSAVMCGFSEAKGAVLVCMDADLSHPPEALPQLLNALRDGHTEFVIGSRYVPGARTDEKWGWFRQLNSMVATLLARPFTCAKDPMAGFFALPREVYERAVSLNPIGYKIGLELIVKCSCRHIQEVPVHFTSRKYGQSKLSLREQIHYLRHLKRLADFKFGVLSKFVQFCLVGATGIVINILAYALLLYISLWVPIAYALAIWLAMTWNFAINRCITFGERREDSLFLQYFRFVAACMLGAILNWSVSMLLTFSVAFFAKNKFLAAFLGIIVATGCNFVLSFFWVFPKKNVAKSKNPCTNKSRRTET